MNDVLVGENSDKDRCGFNTVMETTGKENSRENKVKSGQQLIFPGEGSAGIVIFHLFGHQEPGSFFDLRFHEPGAVFMCVRDFYVAGVVGFLRQCVTGAIMMIGVSTCIDICIPSEQEGEQAYEKYSYPCHLGAKINKRF
ncbi:hypothetical protein [Chitinophaga barathri]|uniref:hypothetical protein n=1 Tax=Chitinophaga barathri TaxID=1647451 RepID=UPI000F4DD7DC|nr:hypothetical protein [Chitinophaga barathri]